MKDPEEPARPRAQQESARNRASEAEARMRTMRNIWEADGDKVEVCPRVSQAILAMVGVMPGSGEIRFNSERGFDVRVANSRYRKVPLLNYAHDLIESGTNPHDSVWGADIHSLPDRAAREDKFVRKMRALLCESDAFDSVYETLKSMFSTDDWTGALDSPAPDAHESSESSASHSPATPSTPAEVLPAPDDTEDHSDASSEEYQAKNASSSSSSDSDEADSDADEADLDDDVPLSKRRRHFAASHEEPTATSPAAEATPEAWLADIAARVNAAREKGQADHLREFLDKHVPRTSDNLNKAIRVERAVKPVHALKETCDFAKEILKARFEEPPPALEDFLRGPDLRRTLNPSQKQILRQAIALIASGKTRERVLIGAGVGVGKTSAALALCAALYRGVVKDSIATSVVVFVPGHLVGQWAIECGETLHAARTFSIPQDTPLNMDSLKAVFKSFYNSVYDAVDRPRQDSDVPVLLLPTYLFNDTKLVCFLEKVVSMLAPVLVFDEPHLFCKRNTGVCGSEVADLLQVTHAHKWVATCIHITATPISKSNEALPYLKMLGLLMDLPLEICQGDDNKAQCVFDALTIKAESDELAKVPKYSMYFVKTQPPPSLDYSRGASQVSRQLRAGNGTPLQDNPSLKAALEAARYAQDVMEKSTLVYYDVKEGVKQLRAAVQQAGWPSFYFLEGDTTASVREKIIEALMSDPGPIVLFTTIALSGVGKNYGKRFHIVSWVGTPVFCVADVKQGIGRAARPPAEEAVASFMYLSSDSYSLDTKHLWEKKQRQLAPFMGIEVAVEGARDDEDAKCLDIADLPSILAGLYALTQDGLVLSCSKGSCFALSAESQLQPQVNARQNKKAELAKIRESIQQAIADQEDPAAAALRRREARRMLMESLRPAEVVPAEPATAADELAKLVPAADEPAESVPAADESAEPASAAVVQVEPAPAADESAEPASAAVLQVEPAPASVLQVDLAPAAVLPIQSEQFLQRLEALRDFRAEQEEQDRLQRMLIDLERQQQETMVIVSDLPSTATSKLNELIAQFDSD